MDLWTLQETGFTPEQIVPNGNRFLLANGYMGCRGTMDEWGSEQLAAINLAGVYDRCGEKWREPVNAPNPLSVHLYINGRELALGKTEAAEHCQTLDYRKAVFSRETRYAEASVQSERFVSMDDCHLLCSRYSFCTAQEAEVELCCGISTDIWDINGPHLREFRFGTHAHEELTLSCMTGQLHIPLAVCQRLSTDFPVEGESLDEKGIFHKFRFRAEAGRSYTLTLYAAIATGLDGAEPAALADEHCRRALTNGYEACRKAHFQAWEDIWNSCAVDLEGCDEAALALHASLYHLNAIAPRHAKALSVPARGLSGQTYKGAVFWDSEIFIFPFFVHTQPEIARSLLRYRIETLPGALKKAEEYGYRGAFYAWESQEGGAEGCTDYNVTDVFTHRPVRTYFRDKQIHISADIAYALWRYYEITGDASLLREGGAEVILQCARFYLSRAHRRIDCDKVELLDVIGPDEYHERVNNNAFTNAMAAYTLRAAHALPELLGAEAWGELCRKLDYTADFARLEPTAERLQPDFTRNEVIEQFDGYFGLEDCSVETVRSRLLDPREYWGTNHGVAAHTQVIKQADVIALMALLPQQFSDECVRRNWAYYEPRTEHGSSLSACMYALTACRIGRADLAWEHFIKSASIDLNGKGKEWAGEIYIGGTHPAANGGAWMIAVLGFAGLSLEHGSLTLHPHLPEQIRKMSFPIVVNGERRRITVTHEGWTVE